MLIIQMINDKIKKINFTNYISTLKLKDNYCTRS